MIKSLLTMPLLLAVATPSLAYGNYYNPGGTRETTCYKTVYREEYVPGTSSRPGYVRRHNDRIEVPCDRGGYNPYNDPNVYPNPAPNTDDNSCIEGAVLGGIAGGGLGAGISRGDGRWWAIPSGIVGGAILGCQIDGG